MKNYLEAGKNAVKIEYESLLLLHNSLDERFVKSVERIKMCRGRVVVTGVGKSALVGQKIVATLNSTGTQALFMHGGDAVHGDLGMIDETDIVICISKSGETEELKLIIPFLKRAEIEVIAMTGNAESYLSLHADDILYTPIYKEADHNNLAPTSSSTVQIAMGDAIAIALCGERGFQAKDFAKYHPGGILGKKLHMRVEDLHPKANSPQVDMEASMREVLLEMSRCRMGATVVLEGGKIRGIITDGDIRRWYEKGEQRDVKAMELMNSHPKVLDISEMAVTAYNKMREHSINQIVIMNGEEYEGMIHLHELLKEGMKG